jgi:hypothetical protein
MPTTATITPTLGSAPVTLQAGNYSAIDDRRFWGGAVEEGYLSAGSFQVIQRAAGANMTVDVQSSVGEGAIVTGDSVTAQGKYFVPPTAANVNVDIAAADATNPRNDLVVLEVKDDQHDASGLNLARVRVITGTPNASAALTNAPGVNGTPALPSSCLALAVVRVAAGAPSITSAAIGDRRPSARPYARLGFASLATAFATSSTHTNYQDEGLSASVSYGASRVLRVNFSTMAYANGGAQRLYFKIVRGSTDITEWLTPTVVNTILSESYSWTHTFNGPVNGTTETFKVQVKAASANTQVQSFGTAGAPRTFTIEDLGAQ